MLGSCINHEPLTYLTNSCAIIVVPQRATLLSDTLSNQREVGSICVMLFLLSDLAYDWSLDLSLLSL